MEKGSIFLIELKATDYKKLYITIKALNSV